VSDGLGPGAAVVTARPLPPAVAAFDSVAGAFDARYGEWASVAAQRRAVRRYLLSVFPVGAHLLELAGGTGEDALYMAGHGRTVLLTDGSPEMVARARARIDAAGLTGRVTTRELLLERLESLAADATAAVGCEGADDSDGAHGSDGARLRAFDGAYSNFAGLNCVADLRPVARGLARLLPAGAPALLVVFGPLPPGEVLTQLVRGEPRSALRRLRRVGAGARINGRSFEVHYPTPRSVACAFTPWFRLRRMRGIGIAVPPSAAEPFVSRLPRVVRALESFDRLVAAPLALLGDHVLLHFERTAEPVDTRSGSLRNQRA
jgi:SAM-dependent methyltransferase